jgi:hypothetical protein
MRLLESMSIEQEITSNVLRTTFVLLTESWLSIGVAISGLKNKFRYIRVRVPLMVKIVKKYFFQDMTIHTPIESPDSVNKKNVFDFDSSYDPE